MRRSNKENNLKEPNSKEVLQIATNDESDIDVDDSNKKRLDDVLISNNNANNLYYDFEFKPKEHQIIALNWLIDLYKNNFKGCLLADDMGLGKTFQVITFINYIIKNKKELYL